MRDSNRQQRQLAVVSGVLFEMIDFIDPFDSLCSLDSFGHLLLLTTQRMDVRHKVREGFI